MKTKEAMVWSFAAGFVTACIVTGVIHFFTMPWPNDEIKRAGLVREEYRSSHDAAVWPDSGQTHRDFPDSVPREP